MLGNFVYMHKNIQWYFPHNWLYHHLIRIWNITWETAATNN